MEIECSHLRKRSERKALWKGGQFVIRKVHFLYTAEISDEKEILDTCFLLSQNENFDSPWITNLRKLVYSPSSLFNHIVFAFNLLVKE